jgi:hypothetical protein
MGRGGVVDIVVRVALGAVALAATLLLWRREAWFSGSNVEQIGGFWTRRPAPPLRCWRHPLLYVSVLGLGWASAVAAMLGHPIVFVPVGAVLYGGWMYCLFRWQGRHDPLPAGRSDGAGTVRGAEGE